MTIKHDKAKIRERAKEFSARIKKLGFHQTEIGRLMKVTQRSVSHYCCGKRNIPTRIWDMLLDLENTPRDTLCKRIVRSRK